MPAGKEEGKQNKHVNLFAVVSYSLTAVVWTLL